MKYIDSERLKAEINKRMGEYDVQQLTSEHPNYEQGAQDALYNLKLQLTSLQQDETQVDIMLCSQVWWEEQGWIMIPPDATVEGIDSLLRQVRKKLQQEQPEADLNEEITDKSRSCCNCVNGILKYPNCYCWQHKDCNTDEPYKIHKEDWVETAKVCKEFESELGLNARKV